MKIEEKYPDVLQNIEFAIVQEYKGNLKILDKDAIEAIQALIREYETEERKLPPRKLNLYELADPVFKSAKQMCEWRLGRKPLGKKNGTPIANEGPFIPLSDLILCLKRIEKSMKTWNKEAGKRGYFDFVQEFIK